MKAAFALLFLLIISQIPCIASQEPLSFEAQPTHQAEIASRLDLGHPDVKRSVVTMARDYPGEPSINQVNAIYRYLVEEKSWSYMSDPNYQDYYKYANETLEDGARAGTEALGDCDDFAILMASLVETLGGSARIIFAYDELKGIGHAYAELYLGEKGDPTVDEIENFIKDEWGELSVPGLSLADDDTIWLNLDYNATYPGGFIFGEGKTTTEVAWRSGNLTFQKIIPLIDSMDSLGSWEIMRDEGSNVSIKNVGSKKGRAIEISYDLKENGFACIARDVNPKIMAELEGINFTYLTPGEPTVLKLVLSDENNTSYSISWNLKAIAKGTLPTWTHLEGYYDDFQRMDEKETDLSEERLNRSSIRRMEFIIQSSSEEAGILRNGSIAIDHLRGVLRIPKASIWNQVKEERSEALAVQLAAESERALANPAKLIESVQLAVESLRLHETLEGYSAIHQGLALLPRCIALLKHDDIVNTLAFSPDGSCLATGSDDNTIRLWDLETGKELHRLEHDGSLNAVAFSPNGSLLATGSRTARLWNVQTGKEIQALEHDGPVYALAFSPDGSLLAMGSRTALLWNMQIGKEIQLEHGSNVTAVAFSHDGSRLATGSDDNTSRIWDVKTGIELQRLEHDGPVYALAFSLDGTTLTTTNFDMTCPRWEDPVSVAHIWDVRTGRELSKRDYDEMRVALSLDGLKLAIGSDVGFSIRDIRTNKESLMTEPDGDVGAMAFSPDGTKLAKTSNYGHLSELAGPTYVWDVQTSKEPLKLGLDYASAVAFSPDGTKLATANGELNLTNFWDAVYIAHIWDVWTGKELHKLEHDLMVNAVAFRPDGVMLATASNDGTARLWDVETGIELQRLDHDGSVYVLAFSSDGTKLATGTSEGTALIWDALTGKKLQRLEHDYLDVKAIAFSPDGTKLATGNGELYSFENSVGSAHIWDVRTGKELHKLEHDLMVNAVAFSPDGTQLATATLSSGDLFDLLNETLIWDVGTEKFKSPYHKGSARIWDSQTGKELHRLGDDTFLGNAASIHHLETTTTQWLGRDTSVSAVVFSPDGSMLATVIDDYRARLWDVKTGIELQRYEHDGLVNALAFSPDGSRLATASNDNKARLWDVKTGIELQSLEHDDDVNALAFSLDGTKLATGSYDGFARIWAVNSQDLICEACCRLGCNLTTSEWRAKYCRGCEE